MVACTVRASVVVACTARASVVVACTVRASVVVACTVRASAVVACTMVAWTGDAGEPLPRSRPSWHVVALFTPLHAIAMQACHTAKEENDTHK
jgi:hypothetical protein